METAQKFKAMLLISNICTVLDQIRQGVCKVSELKSAFYPELISSSHSLSSYMAISLQLRSFVNLQMSLVLKE